MTPAGRRLSSPRPTPGGRSASQHARGMEVVATYAVAAT